VTYYVYDFDSAFQTDLKTGIGADVQELVSDGGLDETIH